MTQLIFLRNLRPLLAALALACCFAQPAAAQDTAAPPPVAAEDLERLVRTIEDPAQREVLVKQLNGLIVAQKKIAGEEEQEVALLDLLSQRIELFTDQLVQTITVLSDAPKLVSWVERQVADPEARDRWQMTLGRLLAVIATAVAADAILRFGVAHPRKLVEGRNGPIGWTTRLPLGAIRLILELVPVAGAAAAAYGILAMLQVKGDAKIASLTVITAYVVARAINVIAAGLFLPQSGNLRLLPFGDETATYLTIWAKRLSNVGVWGFFAIQAFHLLGLPKNGTAFLFKVLGLMVTLMLVIFVLQNRQAVASWIRQRGNGALAAKVAGVRNRIADIWHVLAALYIIAIYAIWALRVKGGFEYVVEASVLTVIILALAFALSGVLKRLVNRAFDVSADLRQRFPQLEARANRYLPLLHTVLRTVVVTFTALAILQAWGINTLAWLQSEIGRRIFSSALSIGAVLIGALLVWELVSSSIERYLATTDLDGNVIERSARARTLLPLARNALMIVLMIMVALIVLSEIGINIAPLLAGAGVVGVALGFGSQTLVKDVITGAFMLFEDQIAIGDAVKIGDRSGTVEAMTIRTIRLRDVNGHVHTIPFSSVAMVTNMSRDFSYALLDVSVEPHEDPDRVMEQMRLLGEELQGDEKFGPMIAEAVDVWGVEKIDPSQMLVRARVKTATGKSAAVQREFQRRMKKRLDEAGIKIPSSTTTLVLDDRNASALAHMREAADSA